MAKARAKQQTLFETTLTRSAFLYGRPNVEKAHILSVAQEVYTSLINSAIEIISELLYYDTSLYFPVIAGQKMHPGIRDITKNFRPEGINSAFFQNAVDEGFTKLANRYDTIRMEMYSMCQDPFTSSKTLFASAILEETKQQMIQRLHELIANTRKDASKQFYDKLIHNLAAMSDEGFDFRMQEFQEQYNSLSLEYKIPHVRNAQIPVDSRLGRIEKSLDTTYPYVVTLTNPFVNRKPIQIPVETSTKEVKRLNTFTVAKTFFVSMQKGGILKVSVPFEEVVEQPKTSKVSGVDIGIRDCLYSSDNGAFGSMEPVIEFYHNTVETSFAGLSDIRNKKRKISFYLRHHNLPEDVRKALIAKLNRLDVMLHTTDRPYQKKRHYYQMVDKVCKDSAEAYISKINKGTLTVLELLDIKDFKKGKDANGKLSMFARGRLSDDLMKRLNQKGYDYIQVLPDYTSQVCPVCSKLDKANRSEEDSKLFQCTCCGYKDDADHVGAINIKARGMDQEILKLCDDNKYNRRAVQAGLRKLYETRNKQYLTKHKSPTICGSSQR